MNALGMYVFGGSQTIGWLSAGFDVNTIFEMTEGMKQNNAYHFVKNYPNISVLLPSEWQASYNNYSPDVLFGNPPCSGLSSINRNANVNNEINNHIFEVVDMALKLKPKVFFIENAPTLTKLGLPILQEISKRVKSEYKLTIINDMAKNHGVAMPRRRTFVIGWNRKYFDNNIPKIYANHQEEFTVGKCFENIMSDLPNMELDKDVKYPELMKYYDRVKPQSSILLSLAHHTDELNLDEKSLNYIKLFENKLDSKSSVWDKSSWRLSENDLAPSLTSVSQLMHPTENRDLYIREYARLMGYPDSFVFYPDECKVPTIQCIAQGVPVKFIQYIATEIKECLTKTRPVDKCDVIYINQCSNNINVVTFTFDEFENCDDISRNDRLINLFN